MLAMHEIVRNDNVATTGVDVGTAIPLICCSIKKAYFTSRSDSPDDNIFHHIPTIDLHAPKQNPSSMSIYLPGHLDIPWKESQQIPMRTVNKQLITNTRLVPC